MVTPLKAGQPLAEGYTLTGPLEPIGPRYLLGSEIVEKVATVLRIALHADYSHLSERDRSREIARKVIAELSAILKEEA